MCSNEDEEAQLTPVITEDGITFIYIKHNNLYRTIPPHTPPHPLLNPPLTLLSTRPHSPPPLSPPFPPLPVMAMTKFNANCMILLNFLYRLVEVFEDYFTELVEESIRDNFVLTYELLDEMMDFGYPQFTEPKILKEYIMVQEKHTQAPPAPPVALTQMVNWRGEGIVHKKNEIFLDVIEKLNIMVNANGSVLRSEIIGSLRMRSFLSGMPELKLGLNDKILMDAHGRGETPQQHRACMLRGRGGGIPV